MIEVGTNDNGGHIRLPLNEQLSVSLPENPTTGYRWQAESDGTPVCRVIADTFAAPGAGASPVAGAGGMRRWLFEATRLGVAEIRFVQRRGWETAADTARSFQVRVEVGPPG